MQKNQPANSKISILGQVCKLIPGHLVPKLARKHGVDARARTFTPWSHVVSLLYAQLTHATGLNDVCDGLRHRAGALGAIRGAAPPARNTLSHGNRVRDGAMMEELFWRTLEHLHSLPGAFGRRYVRLPARFKRAVHAVDSSTIALVANCMDWAKHRRRKAAAKCHLRLDMGSFLPAFAIIDGAKGSDASRAREMCAGLKEGEIALLDRAYVDFAHLHDLGARGVSWVTRAKKNQLYRVVEEREVGTQRRVLSDEIIELEGFRQKKAHPGPLRRVAMLVEVDGEELEMVFLTNNLKWAPSSVGDLYRARWGIEVFFKQLKQTLKVCDFLGHSKNAILWQLWAALLLYVLLRYLGDSGGWPHSFARLIAVLRTVVWERLDLIALLAFYGTAGGRWRMRGTPQNAYLPGLAPAPAPPYGTASG